MSEQLQPSTNSDTLSVKKAAFLAAYAQCGMIAKAARAAKIHRDCHYTWLTEDPRYKGLFDAAHQKALNAWEDEVSRRAFVGTRKPVYQGGKKVGTVMEYSDGLAQFMLKANNREKYGDKSQLALTGGLTLEGMQQNMAAARKRAKKQSEPAGN